MTDRVPARAESRTVRRVVLPRLARIVTAAGSTAAAVWLALRRSPYVWVATALAVGLLAPRTHETYATYLVIGLLNGARDRL